MSPTELGAALALSGHITYGRRLPVELPIKTRFMALEDAALRCGHWYMILRKHHQVPDGVSSDNRGGYLVRFGCIRWRFTRTTDLVGEIESWPEWEFHELLVAMSPPTLPMSVVATDLVSKNIYLNDAQDTWITARHSWSQWNTIR